MGVSDQIDRTAKCEASRLRLSSVQGAKKGLGVDVHGEGRDRQSEGDKKSATATCRFGPPTHLPAVARGLPVKTLLLALFRSWLLWSKQNIC